MFALEISAGLITDLADRCIGSTSAMTRRSAYIIPGLCNAHSHAFQRALAGHMQNSARRQDVTTSGSGESACMSWRVVSMQTLLTAIARQAYCEMLSSGYTSVAEFHYLHRDPKNPEAVDTMFAAISTAAAESGIRLTYVPVHYERAGFDDP